MNDSFSQINTNKAPIFSEEKRFHTCEESDRTFTKDTLNLTTDNNKGKVYLDTLNEKREYEDKILALNNRIKKLEKQEKEINKTTGKMKEKFVLEQKIKADKQEKKELIENFKRFTETEIEKKKQEIEEKRKKRKENYEKISQENLLKNRKNFTNAKNEKIFWESIYNDIKSHNSNMKNYQYLKIKQEFVEHKAGRYKSQIDREEKIKSNYDKKVHEKLTEKEDLKEKLKQLEEKELEYISKLKHTVLLKQQEFETFKTKNLNKSSIDNSNKKAYTSRPKTVKCLSVPKNYK